MGFACKISGHKWNGCKCTRCGEVRDEEHDWDGCICRMCGKVRPAFDESHRYINGKCEKCGLELDKDEIIDIVKRPFLWNRDNHELIVRTLRYAHENFSPNDFDDVLVAHYCACAARRKPDESLSHKMTHEYLTLLNLPKLVHADERGVDDLKHCLGLADPVDYLQQVPEGPYWNDEICKRVMRLWGVADGEIVAPCEIGDHQWELVGKDEEYCGEHFYRSYYYRCKICGEEKTQTDSEKL